MAMATVHSTFSAQSIILETNNCFTVNIVHRINVVCTTVISDAKCCTISKMTVDRILRTYHETNGFRIFEIFAYL